MNTPDSVTRGGEKNECAELRILSLSEIFQMPDSMFAFSHKNIIKSLFGNEIVTILSSSEINENNTHGIFAVIDRLLEVAENLKLNDNNNETTIRNISTLEYFLRNAKNVAVEITE